MNKGLLIVNEFIKNNKERFEALYIDLYTAFLNEDINLVKMTNSEVLIKINEKKLDDYDFVLFWDKDINLAYHLENLGYKLYNSPKAIEICDDKAKTALALENKNIKMPKTVISPFTFSNNPYNYSDLHFLDDVISYLGLPLIVKEATGSFGEQVYLPKDKNELRDLVIKLSPKSMIFQEYIKSSHGKDIRIEVVGGKAIGAVMRESVSGDFRSNVLQGGKMVKASPDRVFYKMAEDASSIIGLDFAGVDILIGENNEPILCEVNSNVHFRTFKSVTNIDLAKEIALYIKKKLEKI
ncbi:MAG: RimK family alpha-L-glutamate ligase [Bacilli bacterium]|nr:RimK family alpha-L-glutamate ligase [Bacilli bacterium]